MINEMAATIPLPGRYSTYVMRDWNFEHDREEIWLLFNLIYAVKANVPMKERLAKEATDILGRCVPVVKTVEPQCTFASLWIAGPITEQEATHIKRTHSD